jgi:hypothetical protein
MNPNTVFSASLVTSLVLWFPSMQACLRGDLDLGAAGLRYLAALLVSRLALNGLARLVTAYRASHEPDRGQAHPASGLPAGPAADADGPSRRRDDRPAGEGVDPSSLAA